MNPKQSSSASRPRKPSYFQPFTTAPGQLLMLVLGSCYLGSLYVLRRIATPRRRERILVRLQPQEVIADA